MSNEERNKDALIAHIQALDTIIRNRNNTITELNVKIAELENHNPPLSEILEKKVATAYRKGWQSAHKTMLTKLRDDHRNQWQELSVLSLPPVEGEK